MPWFKNSLGAVEYNCDLWTQEAKTSSDDVRGSHDTVMGLASAIQAAAASKGSAADKAYIDRFHASICSSGSVSSAKMRFMSSMSTYPLLLPSATS